MFRCFAYLRSGPFHFFFVLLDPLFLLTLGSVPSFSELQGASVSFWELLGASWSFWELLGASGSFCQHLKPSGPPETLCCPGAYHTSRGSQCTPVDRYLQQKGTPAKPPPPFVVSSCGQGRIETPGMVCPGAAQGFRGSTGFQKLQ